MVVEGLDMNDEVIQKTNVSFTTESKIILDCSNSKSSLLLFIIEFFSFIDNKLILNLFEAI